MLRCRRLQQLLCHERVKWAHRRLAILSSSRSHLFSPWTTPDPLRHDSRHVTIIASHFQPWIILDFSFTSSIKVVSYHRSILTALMDVALRISIEIIVRKVGTRLSRPHFFCAAIAAIRCTFCQNGDYMYVLLASPKQKMSCTCRWNQILTDESDPKTSLLWANE